MATKKKQMKEGTPELYSERVITGEEMPGLISRTLTETLIQNQSATLGYTDVLKRPHGLMTPEKAATKIRDLTILSLRRTKAIQEAVRLVEAGLPVPTRTLSGRTLELIDLDRIPVELKIK